MTSGSERLTRAKFAAAIVEMSRDTDPLTLAVELMRRYAGRRIPRASDDRRSARDRRIRAAIDQGDTLDAVAAREGISRRRVVLISQAAE